jgi:hypothetical protein
MAPEERPGQVAWIVSPPELCSLCRGPITRSDERSSWNDRPAHTECVRIHLLQQDPAFRDWGTEPGSRESPGDFEDEYLQTDDDEDPTSG